MVHPSSKYSRLAHRSLEPHRGNRLYRKLSTLLNFSHHQLILNEQLCGALGPASASSGVEYQTCLATFWGSWAFLIGSVIQWYESLDKFPVETKTPSSSEIAADETKV